VTAAMKGLRSLMNITNFEVNDEYILDVEKIQMGDKHGLSI
jgi:hypothetical protein